MSVVCTGAEKPSLKTATDKIEVPGSTVEFTLVQLPAGKITLKDKDGKDKEIEIKPIWIGKTEVTWDEYDIFWQVLDLPEKERGQTKYGPNASRPGPPYSPPDRGWGHDGFPAGSMPFKWAKAYCAWLSKMTGHKFRLPTEAEWEYACRAGGGPVKPDKAALEKMAWYSANSKDQAHHVARKDANGWGLYDMLGNVAEWVVRMDGSEAVAGESVQDEPEDVHSGARATYNKSWQRSDPNDPKGTSWYWDGGHVGFRIVRED